MRIAVKRVRADGGKCIPVALEVPIRRQNHEAVYSRNVHKGRRYGSISWQNARLTDAVLLEELQRAVEKHDTNELFALYAAEISLAHCKGRLIEFVLM